MRHKEIVNLITVTYSEDAVGNLVEVFSENSVYANEFSVGATEYYNAAAQGLRPSKVFEVYSFEYTDQAKLRHNGTIYNIVRSESKGDKCRLVCERIGADVAEPFTAYLSSLTIGILTFTPSFSSAVDTYAAATTNANNVVTAIPHDPTATVTITLNGAAHVNGTAAAWIAGANTIVVTVTNGTDSKAYIVTVTKS